MIRPTFRAVDPGRSRIVLIGTPRYRDERLADTPVVANNVTDLARALTDPTLGGFAQEHCRTVSEDADLVQIGEVLTSAAEQASDLLLVYYSGHGLIDRRGKLYLSLAGTRPDQLAYSALTFDAVRETFLDSPASNRVLILDSCFSGRAIGQPLAGEEQSLLNALEVSGTFTLTAATANRAALILDGERHTAFTERLLRLLQDGSPRAGQMLTLTDIYRHLHAELTAEGLPAPQQRGTNTAGMLGLVHNRQVITARQLLAHETLPMLVNAAVTGKPAATAPAWHGLPTTTASAHERAAPAVEQALRHVAEAGSKQLRRICLAAVAPAVAAIAEEQALGIAATLSDMDRRQSVLAHIAVVVAASDVFRAIDILSTVWEPYRTMALADIARIDGLRHPGNGTYILDTYILDDTRSGRLGADSLSAVARAVAAFAPDRAEEIAVGIPDGYSRTVALAGIALTVAVTDPGRALRLIPSRCSPWAVPAVAEALAVIDPDRALSFIAPLVGQRQYPLALIGVARTIALTDPPRALRIACGITDRARRAEALVVVAEAVAATSPDHALEITGMIGDSKVEVAALADVAPVVAAKDPEWAMDIADGITGTLWKVLALAGIASVQLETGHRRLSATRLAAR
ncbi:caspase domain-containing protein [Streptomyces sp. NPDC006463]|uniref:caspase family protein n=1 Tax=Streptomyces sp. NPDC006463 TaxID=3364746 RepID=UPI0036C589E2